MQAKANSSANTSFLLKTNLKQNLIKNLIWVVMLVGLLAAVAMKFNVLFGTKTDINAIVTTLKTPAMVSLFGDFSASRPYTTANVFSSEMMVFMGMFVVFMNIFIAVHDTRQQEENGLTEMIRSRQVGRRATLQAAAIEILAMNLLVGALFAVSLFGAKLKGATAEGDLLVGATLAGVGLMFGGVSLFIAQLASTSRSANFMCYGVFGATYLIRMMTDVADPDWTWLSPFGWLSKTRIYEENNWLPVAMMLALGLVFYLLAVKIADTRDIGSGVLNVKAGKDHAGRLLSSPLGLVLKLERNSIIGWVIGMFVLGVTYGSIFSTVGDIIGTNPTYKKLLGVAQIKDANLDLLLSFISMLLVFFIIVSAVSGLMVLFRLKNDEKKGFLETIHAKTVSRTQIALSYYIVAILISVLTLAASSFAMFMVGNASLDDPMPMKYLWQSLGASIPAVLFFLAVAFLIVGALPKLTTVVWGYLGVAFMLRMFGSLLDLSKDVNNISPLGWIGKVPQESLDTTWLIVMLAGFVLMSVIGLIGYRRRDL